MTWEIWLWVSVVTITTPNGLNQSSVLCRTAESHCYTDDVHFCITNEEVTAASSFSIIYAGELSYSFVLGTPRLDRDVCRGKEALCVSLALQQSSCFTAHYGFMCLHLWSLSKITCSCQRGVLCCYCRLTEQWCVEVSRPAVPGTVLHVLCWMYVAVAVSVHMYYRLVLVFALWAGPR